MVVAEMKKKKSGRGVAKMPWWRSRRHACEKASTLRITDEGGEEDQEGGKGQNGGGVARRVDCRGVSSYHLIIHLEHTVRGRAYHFHFHAARRLLWPFQPRA